jgi:hypothetical protein
VPVPLDTPVVELATVNCVEVPIIVTAYVPLYPDGVKPLMIRGCPTESPCATFVVYTVADPFPAALVIVAVKVV